MNPLRPLSLAAPLLAAALLACGAPGAPSAPSPSAARDGATVAPAALAVTASPGAASAPRGGTVALAVHVDRADPATDVVVTLPGAPGGLAVPTLALRAGESDGMLTVPIAPNAPLGALALRLRATDGRGDASFPVSLTVTEAP